MAKYEEGDNRQYSTRGSGSGLTYGIRVEDGLFLRLGVCNIPHIERRVSRARAY